MQTLLVELEQVQALKQHMVDIKLALPVQFK
jgi:hypothetical protein